MVYELGKEGFIFHFIPAAPAAGMVSPLLPELLTLASLLPSFPLFLFLSLPAPEENNKKSLRLEPGRELLWLIVDRIYCIYNNITVCTSVYINDINTEKGPK